MNLPRLPAAAEHRIVRLVCGLPPRVSRVLFGAPPVLDGQELEPVIHALLCLDRLVGDESLGEGKNVERTRTERRYEARIVALPIGPPKRTASNFGCYRARI